MIEELIMRILMIKVITICLIVQHNVRYVYELAENTRDFNHGMNRLQL